MKPPTLLTKPDDVASDEAINAAPSFRVGDRVTFDGRTGRVTMNPTPGAAWTFVEVEGHVERVLLRLLTKIEREDL